MTMKCFKRKNVEMIFVTDSERNETQIPSRIADIINTRSEKIRTRVISIRSPLELTKFILVSLTANTENRYIVNTQHFKSGVIVWVVLGLYRICGGRKNKIIRIHTLNSDLERTRGIMRILLNKTIANCECLIGVSRSVLNNCSMRGKKKVIYNCMATEDIELLEKLAKHKNRNRYDKHTIKISWVGRFEDIKRPMDFIDALLEIDKGAANINIKMAGGGSLLKKVEKKVANIDHLLKEKGIYLKLCRAISKTEAKMIIGESDIYINTSASETFSVSTAEAAIDGKKILILPELESMIEIYGSNRTLFFEKGNISHLSRQIEKSFELIENDIEDVESSEKIKSIVSERCLVQNYETLVSSLVEIRNIKKVELTGQAGSGKSTYLRSKMANDASMVKRYDCVGGLKGKIRGIQRAGYLGGLLYIGMTPLLLLIITMSLIGIKGRNAKDLCVGSASVYLKILGSIGYNKLRAKDSRLELVWDEGWLHIPLNLIPIRDIFLKNFLQLVRVWTNLSIIWNDIDEIWISECDEETLRERTKLRKNARERRLIGEDLDEFYNQGRKVSSTIMDELIKQGFKEIKI